MTNIITTTTTIATQEFEESALTTSSDLLLIINEARTVYGEKEVRRNDFVARCKDELNGDHYETFVVKNQNGTESEEIRMTDDQCAYVSMRESKSVRRKVAQRLNAMRKPAFTIPQTMPEALRLAADLAEQRDKAIADGIEKQKQLEVVTPKAQALDRFSTFAEGSMCITNAAKALQLQPKKFFAWLQEHGWIFRRAGGSGWIGYQSRIQVGYLEHKVTTVERGDGTEKTVEQVLITAKGLAKLATDFGATELMAA